MRSKILLIHSIYYLKKYFFKEKNMSKHNSYTLDINPKVSNYQTNGTGRDSYINFNNGGFKVITQSDSVRTRVIGK